MENQYINERGNNMPRKKKTEDENTISSEKEVKKEEKTTISCSPYGRHALREAAKFTNK